MELMSVASITVQQTIVSFCANSYIPKDQSFSTTVFRRTTVFRSVFLALFVYVIVCLSVYLFVSLSVCLLHRLSVSVLICFFRLFSVYVSAYSYVSVCLAIDGDLVLGFGDQEITNFGGRVEKLYLSLCLLD